MEGEVDWDEIVKFKVRDFVLLKKNMGHKIYPNVPYL